MSPTVRAYGPSTGPRNSASIPSEWSRALSTCAENEPLTQVSCSIGTTPELYDRGRRLPAGRPAAPGSAAVDRHDLGAGLLLLQCLQEVLVRSQLGERVAGGGIKRLKRGRELGDVRRERDVVRVGGRQLLACGGDAVDVGLEVLVEDLRDLLPAVVRRDLGRFGLGGVQRVE